MKKLILSAAIVLGGLTAVTAQTEKENTAMNKQQQTEVESKVESRLNAAEDVETVESVKVTDAAVEAPRTAQDYKEVKTAELPKAVQKAVSTDFDGATISKAYKNAKGDYKIELATSDSKKATVYANAQGEWIKNDLKKQ